MCGLCDPKFLSWVNSGGVYDIYGWQPAYVQILTPLFRCEKRSFLAIFFDFSTFPTATMGDAEE